MSRFARKVRRARREAVPAPYELLLFLAVFVVLCTLLLWWAENAPPHFHGSVHRHAH